MHITGKTKILGVIGDPVAHSRSPQMHNAAIAALKLDYVYLPFHVRAEDICAAIDGFKALNVVGINVTIPHKQRVMAYLDGLTREAELIGSVNTLLFAEGRVVGDNTDAPGFLAGMREAGHEPPRGGSAAILGAGGSARAVAVALALAGLKSMVIANRTTEKAIALAADLSEKLGVSIRGIGLDDVNLPHLIHSSQLVVNTTSVSMDETHPLLIQAEWLKPETVVYDIVYTPPETQLMKAARGRGCYTVGGLGMLVHQGAIAFKNWTYVTPPVDIMRRALQEALGLVI